MSGPIRTLRFAAAALVVTGGLIVASCGGGTVNSTPVAQPTATPAPTTQSIPTNGGMLTLNSATARVSTVSFANGVPAGVALTATSSTSAPAGAPAVTSLKRKTQSGAIVGAVPFFWVTFSVSANLSAQYISSETISLLPSDPTTAQYGVEFDDITTLPAVSLGDAGPATLSGLLATFTNGTSTNPPTLTAGHTYLMQFFYVPAGTPTPTPTPTGAAPTPTPTGAAPTPTPTGSASSGPTNPPTLVFGGTTDTISVSPTVMPIPLTLSAYKGIAFTSVQWQPTTSGSGTITLSDATNTGGDITGGTFVAYPGPGTPVMYLQFLSSGGISFPATPTFTVTDTSPFPGSTGCGFFGYINNNSSAYAWTQVSTNLVASTGTGPYTVNLPAVTAAQLGGQISFTASNSFYAAIVCQ